MARYAGQLTIRAFFTESDDSVTQLSIKAYPNTWLPKTLTSVQLPPIIAELCPAMVTYSPSNHSPQYKNIKLFSVPSLE